MDVRHEFLAYLTQTQEHKHEYLLEDLDANVLWEDYGRLREFERSFSASEPFFSRAAREQAEDLRRVLDGEKPSFRHRRNPF